VGCKHSDPQDPAALPITRQRRAYRSHAQRDRHTRRRSAAAARRRTHRRAAAPASKIILLGVLRRHVLGLASATDFARTWSTGSSGPGDRVLDVGCGTGYFTRMMAEAVTFAGPAMGVDPSREAIARARRLTRVANCAFSEGIAQALDAPDGSFDVVVSSLVVHHLPDTLRPPALREMVHLLPPGGRVLIADSRPPTSRIGRHLIGPFTSPAMQNNPVHLLDRMVREAGFEQVRNGDVQPWIRYVQGMKPTGAPQARPRASPTMAPRARNAWPRLSRIRPANDRETSRNDGNGSSIESAGQEPDLGIAAGSEIGSENTLKVETRVQIPLGLPGNAQVRRAVRRRLSRHSFPSRTRPTADHLPSLTCTQELAPEPSRSGSKRRHA